MVLSGTPHDPVQYVQEAVCTQRDEVERVNDGGNGGLPEEQELGNDADGLENFREDP